MFKSNQELTPELLPWATETSGDRACSFGVLTIFCPQFINCPPRWRRLFLLETILFVVLRPAIIVYSARNLADIVHIYILAYPGLCLETSHCTQWMQSKHACSYSPVMLFFYVINGASCTFIESYLLACC